MRFVNKEKAGGLCFGGANVYNVYKDAEEDGNKILVGI